MHIAPLPDNQRRAKIEAAIRRLPVLPEQMYQVVPFADYLELLANIGGDGFLPFHFRPATAKMVGSQLAELKRRMQGLASKIENNGGTTRARGQLARHIRELSRPTIRALSDAPPVILGNRKRLADTWNFQSGMPERLDNDEVGIDELRFWARVAVAAMASSPAGVQNVGRLADNRAQVVARSLALKYSILTGKQPTFSVVAGRDDEGSVYGPFLDFVREVFQILNIKRDALSYASAAARRLRGCGRKK